MAALHCIIIVMFAFIFFFNEVRGHCLERHKSLLLNFKHSLVIDESSIDDVASFNMVVDALFSIDRFKTHFHEKSPKLANWNSSTDCCLWPGVTCSGMYVTGLDLSNEGIVGGFNDSSPLFNLTSLTSLNLASIFTTLVQYTVIPFGIGRLPSGIGRLPSGIGRLVNLMNLNISRSGFSGQIPIEISNLTRLVSLDLSSYYADDLKAENPNLRMLLGNLSNLIDLRLGSVDLSSQSREWCQVLSSSTPRLQVLDLSGCGLSGPIHDSLRNLKHLSVVDISFNNFSGPIPYGVFASLENLTSLTMRSCKFNGVFPHRMLQLPTLRDLDISLNEDLEANPSTITFKNSSLETLALSGLRILKTIPESIGEAKMLSNLDLGNCNLSGQIPESISQLEHLISLDLSYNNLDGHIPSLSRSRNLTYLWMNDNQLNGSILATDWKKLSRMERLILSSNSLSGSIPICLFETPSLKLLNLGENHFTGFTDKFNIMASSSSHLLGLYLDDNDFQGSFPPFIYGLNSLQVLDLSFNNWSDTFQMGSSIQLRWLGLASCNLKQFPPFLTNQSTLWILDLSDNQINGHIPDHIWNMSALVGLGLSNNQISGHIPDQIRNMSALVVLDLSNNQFSGHISDQIWNMSALKYLHLSNIQISSHIPYQIWTMSALKDLDLSNNQIDGHIPDQIWNMSALTYLNLSHNQLEFLARGREEHSCWLPNLYVLNLSKNNINGIIPDTLPLSIRALDLSQNSFHGQIPKSLEGCTNLEVLDLGYNQLHGMFPCWISNLDRLTVLVLRSNLLHGSIQCLNHDFNLSRLQIIDIAFNNFGGNLPSQCLLRWKAMMLENRSTSETGGLHYLQVDQIFTVTVSVTVKGLEFDSIKISTIYTLVDFSDNNFEGEIPHEFGKLTFLYALNLSHNYLSGQIPPSFGNLYGVESLDLSKNELSGKIPAQLASLNALSFLDLSFNQLEGMIPKGSQFQTFTDASFKENKGLCGQPLKVSCGNDGVSSPPNPPYEAEDELGDGFKFRDIFIATEIGYVLGLDLSSNKLHGSIPESICNMTYLLILDLSNNFLSGTLPQFWPPDLYVLNLSKNNINDIIPDTFPLFLRTLDLSQNSFHGKIPKSLEGYTYLKVLDLGYNQLHVTVKGLELVLTKILTIYTLVDFSDNKFEGEIPHEFGKLKFLYALNLSHNYLSGRIPPSFGNLSGGNKGLCGQPLNASCGNESVNSSPNPSYEAEDELGDGFKFRDIFIATEIDYVLGLGLVIMPLLFWSTWRQRYYKYIDKETLLGRNFNLVLQILYSYDELIEEDDDDGIFVFGGSKQQRKRWSGGDDDGEDDEWMNFGRLSVEGNPLVCPPMEVVEQGVSAVKEYLSDKMNETPTKRNNKASWISKLKKYGTFSASTGNRWVSEERHAFVMPDYRSIDGLASPRRFANVGMFAPRRLFSPKTYFSRD
ncbi:unnamed protein product [Rhodiola kirilowii]